MSQRSTPRPKLTAISYRGRDRGTDPGAVRSAADTGVLEPAWSPLRWRGNVVPFVRPDDPTRAAMAVPIDAAARPAPRLASGLRRRWLMAVLAASAGFHAAALLGLDLRRPPPPLASVGVRSISVELVLGTDATAGRAKSPAVSEAAVDAVAAHGKAAELVKPETARSEVKAIEEAQPIEPSSEPVSDQPSMAATQTMQIAQAQPVPIQQAEAVAKAMPASPVAPATPEAPVAISEPSPPKPLTPAMTAKRRQPSHREVRQPQRMRGDGKRTHESRASTASVASSGIGRGRSATDNNYRGVVAAQLARNKSFPAEARRNGEHGSAVISFVIEPGGRVASVILMRASGSASLDAEAQAMVRRASPFPPTPTRRAMRFTVPVTFNIQ